MCARYVCYSSWGAVAAEFGLTDEFDPRWTQSYNISPGRHIPTIRGNPKRTIAYCHWGLLTPWAREIKDGNKLINARAETVAEKPSFREAFKERRCLVVADGFYEWRAEGRIRRPYYFRLRSQRPFGMAGIWRAWTTPEGKELETVAIITVAANRTVLPVHERMPAILRPEDMGLWLDQSAHATEALMAVLAPYDPEAMTGYAVSTLVNKPGNDLPECIEPERESDLLS